MKWNEPSHAEDSIELAPRRDRLGGSINQPWSEHPPSAGRVRWLERNPTSSNQRRAVSESTGHRGWSARGRRRWRTGGEGGHAPRRNESKRRRRKRRRRGRAEAVAHAVAGGGQVQRSGTKSDPKRWMCRIRNRAVAESTPTEPVSSSSSCASSSNSSPTLFRARATALFSFFGAWRSLLNPTKH